MSRSSQRMSRLTKSSTLSYLDWIQTTRLENLERDYAETWRPGAWGLMKRNVTPLPTGSWRIEQRLKAMGGPPKPVQPNRPLMEYIQDDDWWLDQKYDGQRLLWSPHSGDLWNKKGLRVVPPTTILWNHPHDSVVLVDFEYVTEKFKPSTYIPFDVDIPKEPFYVRRMELEAWWFSKFFVVNRSPIYIARSVNEKAAFALECLENGAEGIVLHNIHAMYGEPGAMVKFKFKKTADCIVSELKRKGKDAIGLAVYDGRKSREVGACSLHGKATKVTKEVAYLKDGDVLHKGDVVEIEYLYATEAGRLYQPVFKHKRTDKYAIECSFDQLETSKSKVII